MKPLICVLVFLLGFNLCFSQDWKVYPYNPSGQISFPQDEGRHTSEPIEWWYTAGHVVGQNTGKSYSFMYTFFHYPASVFDGFRILNITDDDTGEFFQDVQPLNYSTLSTTGFNVEANVFQSGIEYWRNQKDISNQDIPFEYELFASSGTGGLDITLETLKRPLILDDDGYLDQGSVNYTYYFSQTSNTVNGNLTFNGVSEPVIGTAWIDRQYGSFNPLTGEKYEWFSMQLSNGMDINLWNIFTPQRTIPDNGNYRILAAYVDETTQYTTSNFNIERLAFNCMPDGAMCYSKQWRLTSTQNNIDVTITTMHDNTEVQLPFRFFEGATTVSGTINGVVVTGIGFAELLHDYENPNVSFTSQQNGFYNPIDDITWDLNNADDGRPVYFDLEYSTDNEMTYTTIVQDLSNSEYTWSPSSLTNGDAIWLRLTARSVDGVLVSSIVNALQVDLTLSDESFQKSISVKLFPNPVKSELQIHFSDIINKGYYHILDISGRIIKNGKIYITDKLFIETIQMQSGVYTIQIITPQKESVFKFIKI